MNNRQIAEEFIKAMIKINKYMRGSKHDNEKNKLSSTDKQFRTLMYLKKVEKSPLKKLGEGLNVSKSSLCIMLNKMVENDLVKRETDSEDRRNTFYSLSEGGIKFLDEEIDRRYNSLAENIGKKLGTEDRQLFLESLKNINLLMDKLAE
ncbi:MarR family winged helix-turn-helix transcriptional regulator [Dethiothermospora halolimnae]|uniref:MarR family winged helix-turn-helix transcriptional regulator n=1 Tax=Dethiothermospora halolimnae TaxID=3114390 RepID=UPI003CCBE08F